MKSMPKYLIIAGILASMIFQSFQCASPEFTGAKLAYNQKDYKKAADGYEKEIAKNPSNVDAWYYLADCNIKLANFTKAAEYALEAQKRATKPDQKAKSSEQIFYIWAESYNKGTMLYNGFLASDKSSDIKPMLDLLNLAASLKPENTEPLFLMGNAYEIKGDTVNAINTYERCLNYMLIYFDIMKERNIVLGMPREEALTQLGKPLSTKSMIDNEGDSLIVDKLSINAKDVYVCSYKKSGGRAIIDGLRANLPESWSTQEKERYFSINLKPLVNLAYLYYGNKNYSKCLQTIEAALSVNPSDDELSSLKIQVYEDQGKTDEVLKSLEVSVNKSPNNKIYLEQYARVLARQKNYDKAIIYYEKALGVDPKFDIAIFNIGACYVNKAAEVIDQEQKKVDANPKYKTDESKCYPFLNKAADYFTQYRLNPVNKDNLGVIQQLSDIYIITRQNDKFKATVTELEALEAANLTNPMYYEYMGKVYAKLGQKDKADKAFSMSDMLRKK